MRPMKTTPCLACALLLLSSGCGSGGDAGADAPDGAGAAPPASAPDTSPAEAVAGEIAAAVFGDLSSRTLGAVKRIHEHDGILLASQPSAADFEKARDEGVRTVINIRHATENSELDERAVVEGLGLVYHNLAWARPEELTPAVIDEYRQLLRSAERPILLHCGSANRVAAIWLAYRVLDDGVPLEQALVEAATVGLRTEAYATVVKDHIATTTAE